ncbi:MAG: L,D-transpeptidase [Patescibacteria group bacterium]
MLKSIYFKLLLVVLVASTVATTSFAVNWTRVVKHPRTPIYKTDWNPQLEKIQTDSDGQILWVDTARQRLSLFKNKKFITSYQITTGKSSTPTPTGTYKLKYKLFKEGDGVKLQDVKGKQIARVSYWFPFIGEEYAFHNASWRQSWEFGKIQHSKTSGSNGCVNMAYADIQDLYNRIDEGTVVHVTK